MDPVPTPSVLRRLNDKLTRKLIIKAGQPPTANEKMDGSSSPQQSIHSPAKSPSGRASFSSVREVDIDIAQAFSSTKVSSYFREGSEEVAVEDSEPSSSFEMAETQFMPPVTQPQSRLHGCWFPAVAGDNFQGWKQIDVRGKQASKSYGDLQSLRMVWSVPSTPKKPKDIQSVPGNSPLERLPIELKSKLT
jgi:hypothetical protein